MDATYSDRPRFGDDVTFIGLADARRLEADRLTAHIAGGAPETVPSPQRIAIAPTSLIGIVPLCARKFLLDFDLPLSWRSYLFVWMVSRYCFSQIRRIP